MPSKDYREKVEETVLFLQKTLPFMPNIVIQLGTGLSNLVNDFDSEFVIPYNKIPNFPQSTVKSHQGNLHLGTIHDQKVLILQGRFHFYEGYSTKEVAFPIRVTALIGAKIFISTNAAGGLNPNITPGSIMIIKDHLNFIGDNPLRGPNFDDWGPRFPDLSEPYNLELIDKATQCAKDSNINKLTTGVYACIPGPSLETPAETRWLRKSGADAVGMSSVPEIIVAIHAGMQVLGLSVISNINDPDNFQPILLDDIIETAELVEPQLIKLINEFTKAISQTIRS